MPYLPELTAGEQSRAMTEVFLGYNHNLRIAEGEWHDEQNLTSAHYPLFSQRPPRSIYLQETENRQVDTLNGILAKDALAWIEGSQLYYNGYAVSGVTLSTKDNMLPKQMVSMGAYLCVFPDGVYVNTADLTDCGHMAADFTTNGNVTFTPCNLDGQPYTDVTVSASEPASPTNGMLWLDTSQAAHALKQFSEASGAWAEIVTVYTKIAASNIGKQFKDYDGVTISGIAYSGSDTALKSQLEALNTDAVLYAVSDDALLVVGLIDQAYTQTSGSVRIERKVPKMNYVCESNNRLWGCYYGFSANGTLNEIYACKLGDFKNWNCFMGLSTDSYIVSVGTDGDFTGCIAFQGYPVFFKENYIHKLYGSYPGNFQLQTTACRGVQKGCANSLSIVNEVLYYKSRADVCAYDGSLPTGVSSQLGEVLYGSAAAGTYGGRYYVSMLDGAGQWSLFNYDTARGVWHREDDLHVSQFAAWGDSLFAIDKRANQILDLNGRAGDQEAVGEIRWRAESGLIGYEMIDRKYVSRFNFRMRMGAGAKCTLYMQYDSDGVWREQGTVREAGTATFLLPVIPRRCDHFRIRLTGNGDVKIYSMAKIVEQGSDG